MPRCPAAGGQSGGMSRSKESRAQKAGTLERITASHRILARFCGIFNGLNILSAP